MASTGTDQPAETTAPAEAPAETPAAEAPAAEEKKATEGEEKAPEEKPERKPLDPEAAAKRKAERAERRKEQRKAARQAAKEAKANGEAPKPKAAKAEKSAKPGDVPVPEGASPKITVAKIPASINASDFKALFEPYGTVLRAEVSKRKGRPTIGTVYYNTHQDVKRAVAALHGKHTCTGETDPISIQYAKDAVEWGAFVKKSIDGVADLIRQYNYKPSVLRSKDAKDLLNRLLFARKKAPSSELMTAAVLVSLGSATAQELVNAKLINSTGPVLQLLQEEKAKVPAKAENAKASARGKKEETKAAPKLDKTFDAVVPHLDKLEKDRWNRMAKANLRLNERHRFRFVDILATPSLELWRWMVEDCEITPAEAGTCFAILQNYYGFTK